MNYECGCCEGLEQLTPMPTANRPGLSGIAYRVGTHATFLETMKARLSGFHLDVPANSKGGSADQKSTGQRIFPLSGLTTRQSDDPAIGLLDAWATVGDVLTFYQERIANEGYLRTACERRSVLELARLIGYNLRPGVASTVFLALTLEKGHAVKLKPGEIKAQSVPGPGELPQTFENDEKLEARSDWNTLGPRTRRPQTRESIEGARDIDDLMRIYLKGTATNLTKNDPLLIDFADGTILLFRVIEVVPDSIADRTLVRMNLWSKPGLVVAAQDLREVVGRLSMEAQPLSGRKTVQRVLEQLDLLNEKIDQGSDINDLLLDVRDVRDKIASINLPPGSSVVRPFLDSVIKEFEAFIARQDQTGLLGQGTQPATTTPSQEGEKPDELRDIIAGLGKPPSVPPRNALHLPVNFGRAFAERADTGLQLLGAFQPALLGSVQRAVRNVPVTSGNNISAYVLRAKTAPFGHNAPLQTKLIDDPSEPAQTSSKTKIVSFSEWPDSEVIKVEALPTTGSSNTIYLDGNFDKILQDGWIVIDTSAIDRDTTTTKVSLPQKSLVIARVGQVASGVSRAAYGMSGPSTRIQLVTPGAAKPAGWIKQNVSGQNESEFQLIRRTVVLTQSEELTLAEEPIDQPICDGTGDDEIELDDLYSELKAGRWLIISGERADIPADSRSAPSTANVLSGIKAAELSMLAEVRHDVVRSEVADDDKQKLPGDSNHTFIRLAKSLEYCYKRDTVTIYTNVVKASHGETRNEVLGAGDAAKPFQAFTLSQTPLTYVPSPKPAGAESTLKVYVNDVEWHEVDTLAGLGPIDRKFVTLAEDEGKTTVVFGNGERGARPPTGSENIRAVYRNGIGRVGNVAAEQISQLGSRPLGVKDVINPLRSSGGADKEDRDQARRNAPLTVTSLDRVVSTEDYADFARTFAGIGKSRAVRLSDGQQQLAHLTIAGASDIPIDKTSDLFRNLTQALRTYGDPFQPLRVEMRELMFLVISAGVHILPDYVWDPVVTNVRAKLLNEFSFERRELGQDALLSEVISAIQAVRGVSYVDVDVFGGVAEKITDSGVRRLQTPQEILDAVQGLTAPAPRVPVNLAAFQNGTLHPAQLAYLTPEVPATLILNQI
jgi:predicted phage baseplate assembly protein